MGDSSNDTPVRVSFDEVILKDVILDNIIWIRQKNDQFAVNSRNKPVNSEGCIPTNWLGKLWWEIKTPYKDKFMWLLTHNAYLT